MTSQLGVDWREKFLEFNENPIAAASIGQVHWGRIKDGREVAIKVQYPGVKESIDSDLNNIKWFLVYTKMAPKSLFLD